MASYFLPSGHCGVDPREDSTHLLVSPGPALHLAGLLFSLHLEFVFVADGETCFHRNDCPRGRLYSQIPRMGRQGTLQGMLGSTHAGQEGLQCGFKKWMGKAGQTALALAVCIFVWFGFFFSVLEIKLRAIRICT